MPDNHRNNHNQRNCNGGNNQTQNQAPTKVTAPYNFVPYAEADDVYHPDWSHQVSHDVPFKDGLSGEIRYTLTAETPIFIRNGHAGEVGTSEFSHYEDDKGNKQYFIPGSSIKGMVRNVLEIMSRGKMTQINDHRHSVRQIFRSRNNRTDEGYSLKAVEQQKMIEGGYLVREGNSLYIYPCSTICKIHYKELDRCLETKFEQHFKPGGLSGINSNFKHKAAKYKYEHKDLLKLHTETKFFKISAESEDGGHTNVLRYASIVEAGLPGRIIASGQSTSYGDGGERDTSRKGEYVFIGDPTSLLTRKESRLEVKPKHLEAFLLINRHEEAESEVLEDWKYWKPKYLKNEPVPVFFRQDSDGGIKDFGLTFMYKEPVQHSTRDLLPTYENKLDLAETMFGTVDQAYSSIKGRVFCGQAKATTANPSLKIINLVLSSPRSSYTPFYLDQKSLTGHSGIPNTYNSPKEKVKKGEKVAELRLRGFKRYPIHNHVKSSTQGSTDMQSHIRPLMPNSTFHGVIRYHNLRPIEVGALLSALTFHGKHEVLRHSIGQAKPYGYGRVKISNVLLDGRHDMSTYLSEYESILFREGRHTDQILTELAAIASTPKTDEALTYLDNPKDFVNVKNIGEYLKSYSSILGVKNNEVIKPIPPPIDEQQVLKGEWTRYSDFTGEINRLHDEWGAFSKRNKDFISKMIIGFWNGEHRPSKKKLQKENSYEWRDEGNIPKWLGLDRANELLQHLRTNT